MMTVKLSKENKFWLFGSIAMILIGLFTYFVIRTVTDISDSRHKKDLIQMNQEAQIIAQNARRQVDSISMQNELNYSEQINIKMLLKENSFKLENVLDKYNQSRIEINNLKNEKNYIPLDASTSEQSRFLSDYIYQPY